MPRQQAATSTAVGGRPAAAAVPEVDRPRPPRWRDRRLVAGVLLVALCVVLGSRVLAAADQRAAVWSLRHDLAAGSLLAEDDLAPALAAIDPGLDAYVAATGGSPVGYRVVRDLRAAELLPVAAVEPADGRGPRRLVTVPVEPLHAPPGLARGERVDVYVTARETPGAADPAAAKVLSAALVAEVDVEVDGFGAGDQMAVVVDLAAADADLAVAAVRRGAIDLVRVP